MFNYIAEKLKAWRAEEVQPEAEELPDEAVAEPHIVTGEADQLLEDPYATIVIRLREDGEFTIGTEFDRVGDEQATVSAQMLQMINSGFLAEFFIQSLNVWAEDVDQKKFVIEILRQWRVLHEQYEKEHDQTSHHELAVDPSEVFGLRRMKGPDI